MKGLLNNAIGINQTNMDYEAIQAICSILVLVLAVGASCYSGVRLAIKHETTQIKFWIHDNFVQKDYCAEKCKEVKEAIHNG